MERKKITTLQLGFLVYAITCSGAYGFEEMVSVSGPGLALALLIAVPLLFAAPIALVVAELTARYPADGGYYSWVRMAYGDMAGFLAGWFAWLSMFTACAACAVNFATYLTHIVPTLRGPEQFIVSAGIVWVATGLNYRGIHLVGIAAVLMTVIITFPTVSMTTIGLFHWTHDPIIPLIHPDKPQAASLSDGLLIALFLFGGSEKLTVNTAEVKDPQKAFPVPLLVALLACIVTYFAPTLVALSAHGGWAQWTEGHFAVIANDLGGAPLGAAMAVGGMASNLCLLMVMMLAQSRMPMVLAQDGMFPALFAKQDPKHGTPVRALIFGSAILTPLCLLPFIDLTGYYSLVQLFSYILLYLTFFKLRRTPGEAGIFRVPLSSVWVGVLALPTIALAAVALFRELQRELDESRLVIIILLFISGPLTYYLVRQPGVARP